MMTHADLLTEQTFLTGLRPIHIERLSYYAKRAVFRPGQRIFSEGSRADRFWIIRDGLVHLDTNVPGQGQVVVETLSAGAVLGWSWLFPPHTWHFGAVAAQQCLAVEFDGPGVLEVCQRDPELGYELTRRFLPVVVDRLQATRTRLLDLYQQKPPRAA
jgi:CRP/FNR family transcriptional regulator, cyclic AMP receptor protein